SDTAPGYMTWYFRISHPYIIHIPAGHSVMPAESDAGVYNEIQSAYTLTFVPNQGGPSSSSQH
ncbi:hypothetical protein A2U01_0102083, partial [Trifolium medium]|nr:hypothetical protein [Trifolium medium]